MPGDGPGGFLITAVIGMLGALVGGVVVTLLGGTGVTEFNIWSVSGCFGAVVLLAIFLVVSGSVTRLDLLLPSYDPLVKVCLGHPERLVSQPRGVTFLGRPVTDVRGPYD